MAEEKAKFKFPKRLIIVYATVFVDAFGYSFIMPILPYYTESLNGTAFELGVLLSIYALTQAFSCLIMGAGSDVFGRKFFLILSLFGSWAGPLIQSFAPTMILFIVFRGLTGLLGGSATVGQAYIADVVPVEYRANYLAQVGAILSCAFVIGPAFGGFLAEINIHMPFWFAAGCALIVFIISFWGIQETNQEVIRKRDLNNEKKKLLKKPGLSEEESKRLDEVNSELKSIEEEAKAKKEAPHEKLHWTPLMIVCLILKFFNESSAIIFDSVFLLYIKDMFQSTTLNNSILICTTGIISFLCPVLFFPLLHDKMKICVSEICIICSILMICGYLMMNFVPFLWFAYISCNVMFLGSSTIYNLPSVVISAQAPPSHQGQAISMVTMAAQCAYVAIPLIATAIYERNKQQALMLGLYFSIVVAILSTVLYFMPGGRTCENGKPEVEANTEEEKKEEENVDIESKGEEILNTKAIQIEKTEKIEVPVAVISPETTTSPAVISASDITPVKAIPVDVKPIQVN